MAQQKTQKVAATASATGTDDRVAKSASPEEVEEANKAALDYQNEQRAGALEAELSRARGDDAVSERTYVEDDDGTRRLAAAPGQQVPAWAREAEEKSGGKSNTPSRSGPEETA